MNSRSGVLVAVLVIFSSLSWAGDAQGADEKYLVGGFFAPCVSPSR
jgi:hypothetical protein